MTDGVGTSDSDVVVEDGTETDVDVIDVRGMETVEGVVKASEEEERGRD